MSRLRLSGGKPMSNPATHRWGYIHPTAIIGDPPEHRDWLNGVEDLIVPPGIDPTARINSYVTVDAGLAALGPTTIVGAKTLLMTKSHVGHNAQIGDGVEVAPGAVIGGSAVLEDGVKVGMNATVKPFVTVGQGARVGMGAVVIRDVAPGSVVAGNPAKEICS